MYRGFKEKVKVIEVRPACEDDTGPALPLDGSHENAVPARKERSYSINVRTNVEKDPIGVKESIANTLNTAEENTTRLQKVAAALKSRERARSNVEEEVTKVKPDNPSTATKSMTTATTDTNQDGDHVEQGKKNMMKNRGKKKKKSKKQDKDTADEAQKEPKTKNANEEVDKTKKAEEETAESAPAEENKRTCPCIKFFNFISSWMVKRKEKRRAKKRKAIKARTSTTPEQLVQYEHTQSKGGVAFTIEVDDRPMKKAVLPPIKQMPGGLMNGIDEKRQKAEQNRTKELTKKKKSSKEHAQRLAECKERKADNEFYYKQKVDLTTKSKQCKAEKNRTRIQNDPSILRAPSTLPPMRVIRVKLADGTDAEADDDLYDF